MHCDGFSTALTAGHKNCFFFLRNEKKQEKLTRRMRSAKEKTQASSVTLISETRACIKSCNASIPGSRSYVLPASVVCRQHRHFSDVKPSERCGFFLLPRDILLSLECDPSIAADSVERIYVCRQSRESHPHQIPVCARSGSDRLPFRARSGLRLRRAGCGHLRHFLSAT